VSAVRVCRYSGEAQGLKPLMGAAPEGGPAARPGHTSSAHAAADVNDVNGCSFLLLLPFIHIIHDVARAHHVSLLHFKFAMHQH
jgi:hypothetical protein